MSPQLHDWWPNGTGRKRSRFALANTPKPPSLLRGVELLLLAHHLDQLAGLPLLRGLKIRDSIVLQEESHDVSDAFGRYRPQVFFEIRTAIVVSSDDLERRKVGRISFRLRDPLRRYP